MCRLRVPPPLNVSPAEKEGHEENKACEGSTHADAGFGPSGEAGGGIVGLGGTGRIDSISGFYIAAAVATADCRGLLPGQIYQLIDLLDWGQFI